MKLNKRAWNQTIRNRGKIIKTLLEKPLTNSPIHILAIQRMNNLALKISKKDKTDIVEER